MSRRRIRRREFVWAALAAGLAGLWLYRQYRAKREQRPAAVPEPRPGLPPYPHKVV